MLEILIYIIILLVSYKVSALKYRKKINVVSLFTAIWCVFGSISVLGLYGLRQPDIRIHLYAWTFICIVNLIILMGSRIRPMFSPPPIKVSNSRIILVQILTIILVTPSLLRSIQVLLATGSLTQVRVEYFSNGLSFGNIVLDLFFNTVPSGLITALIVYYIYLAYNRKQLVYVLYAFLNAAITFFLSGGRTTLFVMFGTLLVVLSYSNKTSREDQKYLRRVKQSLIYLVICFILLTLLRGSESFLQSLVVYFSGSLSFLDYILENPNDYGLHDGYMYGYMIFGFITEPIVLVLKVLGLSDASIPSYYFNIYCQDFVDISSAHSPEPVFFNNNTSVLFFFIRDMGFLGVLVGSIFYGTLLSMSYNKWIKRDHFWGLCHIFICQTLLYSIMGYSLKGYSLVFTLFAFKFLIAKQRP